VTFPTREEVVRIRTMLIELYGGAHGLRDEGMLRSAVARPEANCDGSYL
jgi:prophage maintenance system killer protein